MSETENEQRDHVRTFDATLTADGRTIEARVVPYGVVATVSDPWDPIPYQESFERGAFQKQLSAPDRVKFFLNVEHERGFGGIVGFGKELEDREDGLYARFRVLSGQDGDKALELVHERVLEGVSLEFAALRTRVVEGVRRRVRAALTGVALARRGAYPGADIIAVRNEIVEYGEDLKVVQFDPNLASSLTDLGFDTKRLASA